MRMVHIGKKRFEEGGEYFQIYECPKCGNKLTMREKGKILDCSCKVQKKDSDEFLNKRVFFNMQKVFGNTYPSKTESGIVVEDGDSHIFENLSRYHNSIRINNVTGMTEKKLKWWTSKNNILNVESNKEKNFMNIDDMKRGTLAVEKISKEPVIVREIHYEYPLIHVYYMDNSHKWLNYKNFRVPYDKEISSEKREILCKNLEITR